MNLPQPPGGPSKTPKALYLCLLCILSAHFLSPQSGEQLPSPGQATAGQLWEPGDQIWVRTWAGAWKRVRRRGAAGTQEKTPKRKGGLGLGLREKGGAAASTPPRPGRPQALPCYPATLHKGALCLWWGPQGLCESMFPGAFSFISVVTALQ